MAGITVEGHQGIVFQTDTGGKPIGYVFSSQEVSQGSSYKEYVIESVGADLSTTK